MRLKTHEQSSAAILGGARGFPGYETAQCTPNLHAIKYA